MLNLRPLITALTMLLPLGAGALPAHAQPASLCELRDGAYNEVTDGLFRALEKRDTEMMVKLFGGFISVEALDGLVKQMEPLWPKRKFECLLIAQRVDTGGFLQEVYSVSPGTLSEGFFIYLSVLPTSKTESILFQFNFNTVLDEIMLNMK